MTFGDGAGLAGVALTLLAYAAATLGKLDPRRPLALAANLVGACLILFSLLTERFNLAATTMEGAWALVALVGLLRLGTGRLGTGRLTGRLGIRRPRGLRGR
jgi:hypothetical protein